MGATDEVEAARLAELASYEVMDSGNDPALDEITRLLARSCSVPIALISLLDSERQWFKSVVGLSGVRETPREVAFCRHTIRQSGILEVPDATRDPRFSDNPLVVGGPRIRHYAGAPVLSESGRALGTLCVIDDAPGELDAQARACLQELAAVVSRILADRRRLIAESRELDAQRLKAVEASRAKSQFVAMMSHELRTPLNAVIGFAEIIAKQSLGPDAGARYAEYAGDVVTSGRHLLALVNDVLDVSKIETGDAPFEVDLVEVDDVYLETRRLTRGAAIERGVEVGYAGGGCVALADHRGLKQVLVNLVSNAIKYGRAGGRVEVACVPDGVGRLILSVCDDGPGISETLRERVFRPFERGAHAGVGEGTGLGLVLVRRLAERMGGSARLDVSCAGGLRAEVVLPEWRGEEADSRAFG